MAPTIQAQHVVAVTIPTIAVIFLTYLWYKKRSNSVTRGRSDPGGGGTSKKRIRHRTTVPSLPNNIQTPIGDQELFPEVMKNAMQKAMRDLETAAPIQEICSDSEETCNEKEIADLAAIPSSVEESNATNVEEVSQIKIEENSESEKIEEACENAAEESTVEENSVDKQMKSEVQAEPAEKADSERKNELCSDKVENVQENGCDSKKNIKTEATNQCCANQRQKSDRSRNQKEKTPPPNENLDVAMQKLESMRIPDKSKRKTSTSKRQNIKENDENKNGDCGANRVKSPVTVNPPTSKSKKRKSKKKSKNNGDVSDDSTLCKTQTDTEVSSRSACDSKNYDVCVDRTDKTKCALRVRVPDSEIYINSHDDDSLRCSIKNDDCDRKVGNHQEDCDNERDSANHSPVDNILDSQSVQFSDAHSEGSSDSGKGCSEGAMSPSPQTPAGGSSISGDQNAISLYQFVIPQEHVGKLIGKHGQFINTIKANSNTRIYIKKHPISFKKKICALEGTQQEIDKALELIRNRFPVDAYPDITLDEFRISLPIACPLRSELFQLDLVEGVNNDVVISSVVSAGHLFLQQPMHPSYQSLTILNLSMNEVYNCPEAPLVLKPVKDNIVAAPAMDGWYRAQIVSVNESNETCEVRFLDYGGYLTLNTSCLRAVRADFLTLPFQAVECFLANVSPISGTWCEEAKLVVQSLTYGQILQAQVYDYTSEGIPLILLYAIHGSQVILINEELVARGFAYPTLPNDGLQTEEYYVYS